MQLEITETDEGFKLKGEVDLATAGDLSELLRTAGRDPIVLDLTEVSFMDSSGLRALLEGACLPNETGPVVIVQPSPQVRRLFDISIPGGVAGLEVRPSSGGSAAAPG
jgi:anti-anti-sigma factor